MRMYICFALLLGLTTGFKPTDQAPEATISNGLIAARLYLPDPGKGYYRGSRFDWSGVIPELQYQGHSYFGKWFVKYSPTLHDAIMGPVEDYSPVGYDEAKTGESFLKIGIGMLTKPEEAKYFFVNPYPIVNPGKWRVKKKTDQVTFVHLLKDKSYSYEYTKVVALVKGKPQMVLSHTLKNTGSKPIETKVYNHNFLVMDQQPVGTGFVIKLPFQVAGQEQGNGNLGKIQGNEISYQKDLLQNQHLQYLSLQGFGASAADYDIRVENRITGAAVRITSDQPLTRLAFWSTSVTLCPEPYINIKVNPGESYRWKILYEFYTCEKQSKKPNEE